MHKKRTRYLSERVLLFLAVSFVAFDLDDFLEDFLLSFEGFASLKNLAKQDGTSANVGETLAFKVVEFNKSNKKIGLSHVRTWEEPAPRENKERNSEADATQKAVKKLKANLEKTTLGDISELAALKAEMENAQNK